MKYKPWCHSGTNAYMSMVTMWRSGVYHLLQCAIYTSKQAPCRPGQALRISRGFWSSISRQSAHEGGKVVSPMHQPPLLLRKHSWNPYLSEAESTPGPQFGWKDYVNEKLTPSGIKLVTFQLVARCLNQPCTSKSEQWSWYKRVCYIVCETHALFHDKYSQGYP